MGKIVAVHYLLRSLRRRVLAYRSTDRYGADVENNHIVRNLIKARQESGPERELRITDGSLPHEFPFDDDLIRHIGPCV